MTKLRAEVSENAGGAADSLDISEVQNKWIVMALHPAVGPRNPCGLCQQLSGQGGAEIQGLGHFWRKLRGLCSAQGS